MDGRWPEARVFPSLCMPLLHSHGVGARSHGRKQYIVHTNCDPPMMLPTGKACSGRLPWLRRHRRGASSVARCRRTALLMVPHVAMDVASTMNTQESRRTLDDGQANNPSFHAMELLASCRCVVEMELIHCLDTRSRGRSFHVMELLACCPVWQRWSSYAAWTRTTEDERNERKKPNA